MGYHGQEKHRHRAHWAVLVLGWIWLFVLHTRLNRAFRSVFRFFSDNISDRFCIVCTQPAFFIKKQKDLGDFQITFQTKFASSVPDLADSYAIPIIFAVENERRWDIPPAKYPTTSFFDVLSCGDFGFISWGNQEKNNRTQIRLHDTIE